MKKKDSSSSGGLVLAISHAVDSDVDCGGRIPIGTPEPGEVGAGRVFNEAEEVARSWVFEGPCLYVIAKCWVEEVFAQHLVSEH